MTDDKTLGPEFDPPEDGEEGKVPVIPELVETDDSQSIVPANNLLHMEPVPFLRKAYASAPALGIVSRRYGWEVQIGPSRHAKIELWQAAGAMFGVFPVTEWTRELPDHQGWEACVRAQTLDGVTVGRAESMCTRQEPRWSFEPPEIKKGPKKGQRPEPAADHALRSMAQTRAASKALSGPLRFFVAMAGLSGTPAEEMDADYA